MINKFWKLLLVGVVIVMNISSLHSQSLCPQGCSCNIDGGNLVVDCSCLGFSELPEFEETEIQMLDLSDNLFTSIPSELSAFPTLEYLDLSTNQISKLSSTSLTGLTSLRILNLSKNNITNWVDINPNTILMPARSLLELNLAGNPLTSFSSNDEGLILISPTLRSLDLSNCKITKISGQEVIQGMQNLEQLYLNGNPLRGITDISSISLRMLDLSNCRLSNLQSTAFINLVSLAYINLSKNHRLSLSTKSGEFVRSDSLKKIDLSYCNMDFIDLDGFPNLKTAVLKGNMVRQLSKDTFLKNVLLENLDLSSNSITHITANSFKHLKHLKHLDLSFNMIPRIDRETFKENELLTVINLSRNYLSRFSRIVAVSLTHLNMSWCEIMMIDPDALGAMPELTLLDLSNNLITEIPDTIASGSLEMLDFSMCRISSIHNSTFSDLPNLSKIDLSGNRFTTTFKTEYFAENKFLDKIWLSDNPWRCECKNLKFLSFFQYLTDPPGRVWDKQQLRCMSPEEVYGRSWENACGSIWFPPNQMGTTEKIWTFFMVSIIAVFGCFFFVMSVKKAIEGRQKTRREREREANLEEQREIVRQSRSRMQQLAQLNAPDARESRPPCYEDALLMPRLDAASFASLDELGLRGKRRKRRKTVATDEPEVQLRRCRCRSEEVLSMRETVYQTPSDSVVESTVPRQPFNKRLHPFEVEEVHATPETRSSPIEELHYHSTDILKLIQNPASSSSISHEIQRAVASSVHRNLIIQSFENIEDFNDKSNHTSPYAKRRIKHMSSFKGSKHSAFAPVRQTYDDEIMVVDDYFPPEGHSDRSNDDDSNEFSTFSTEEIRQMRIPDVEDRSNSDSSSIVVLVHNKPVESNL